MSAEPESSHALPSTRTLLRSTLIAAAVACVLLVGAVLPAEYGVDPTGIGRVLGLTQMGRLKLALLQEEADLQKSAVAAGKSKEGITAGASNYTAAATHRDSMTVTLIPTQRVEVKLAMTKGQVASYRWSVDSGAIYFNLHGEAPKSAGLPTERYGSGSLRNAEGDITAAFDGVHGWYWENQTDHTVQVTVRAWGQFQELRKM